MSCFLSSFVRLLQLSQSSCILIFVPLCSRRDPNVGIFISLSFFERGRVPLVLHKVHWWSPCSGTMYFLFLWRICTVPTLAAQVTGVGASTEISISSLLPPPSHSSLIPVIFVIIHCIHTPYVQLVKQYKYPPNRSSWISSAHRIKNQMFTPPLTPLLMTVPSTFT